VSESSTVTPPKQDSIFRRLYNGETDFTFVSRWRIWFGISGTIIVLGLVALGVRGLNLGIDFTGGNQWEVPAGSASVADVEDAIGGLGFDEVEVQEVGDDLRVQTEALEGTDEERRQRSTEVVEALTGATGAETNEVVVNEVGPSWGEEISRKALQALVVFLVAIAIYITIRFEFRMALATLGALIHDILIVIGTYAILQLPVTPATVVAILTILGFSIYDGIVVFDRVDENTHLLTSHARMTYSDMVDRSLNEVLMRSLNTQITAIIPIISVLVVGSLALGADTLQEFGLALFIGQLSGAYSSIFIASPLLALLKEREPRYKALRERLAGQAEKADRATVAREVQAEAAADEVDDTATGAEVALGKDAPRTGKGARATSTTAEEAPAKAKAGPPPRPRKKGKRR
jgi:preprotein translocase subunit SecF